MIPHSTHRRCAKSCERTCEAACQTRPLKRAQSSLSATFPSRVCSNVLAEAFALWARRWSVICDAGRDSLLIPRLLTWSTEPRSREYLNAKDLNLDHSYFAPAYPPYGEEGERLARARNPFLSPRCPLPSRAAEEAGPSTGQEPRKRALFQEAAREIDFQDDLPVFSEVAEALQAAASGTVVGAPEEHSDALDL